MHWDAVREGVEDFEELSMLKDAIEKSRDANWKAHAQKVLDDAVKVANTVTSKGSVDDDKGILIGAKTTIRRWWMRNCKKCVRC